MAEDTKIAWADHTINFWIGCTKVSPACEHCYAEKWDGRFRLDGHAHWGDKNPRLLRIDAARKEAFRYQRRAEKEGRRFRVFTNSLSDFFEDRRDLDLARLEALDIMAQTPNLDWLILTKRPEQIRASLIRAWSMAVYGSGLADFLRAWTGRWGWDTMAPANVWLGTTVESQHQIGRVDALLDVPAAVHFVSAEPLLGPILLNPYLYALAPPYRRIDWVICGGESGPQARWMDPQWAREVLVQCAVARVPSLFKQMGGRGRDKGGRTLDGRMFEQFPEGPCTTP